MSMRIALVTLIATSALLLSLSVVGRSVEAQVIVTSVDQDYVSNAPNADNDFTVTITDTDQGATLAASRLEAKNLTSGTSTDVVLNQQAGATYTATVSVTSTASTPGASITAFHGDHIQIIYTDSVGIASFIVTSNTRLPYVIVDAQGPTITNQSPADLTETGIVQPTLEADVEDVDSGLGQTPGVHPVATEFAQVEANVTIKVGTSEALVFATGPTDGVWHVERITSINAGSNVWNVRAKDALGNETLTADITITLDQTTPTLNSAATGVTLDATAHARVLSPENRRAIELVFDGALDGASIASDGSDFRVELSLGTGALAIDSAAHDADAAIDERVYLTMVDDLPPGSTPLITIVGVINDKAGNSNQSGENVTAVDGLSPVATVSLLVGATPGTLTNRQTNIRLVSDEAGVDATQTSDPSATTGLLVQTPFSAGRVFPTSTVRAANTFTLLSAGT